MIINFSLHISNVIKTVDVNWSFGTLVAKFRKNIHHQEATSVGAHTIFSSAVVNRKNVKTLMILDVPVAQKKYVALAIAEGIGIEYWELGFGTRF